MDADGWMSAFNESLKEASLKSIPGKAGSRVHFKWPQAHTVAKVYMLASLKTGVCSHPPDYNILRIWSGSGWYFLHWFDQIDCGWDFVDCAEMDGNLSARSCRFQTASWKTCSFLGFPNKFLAGIEDWVGCHSARNIHWWTFMPLFCPLINCNRTCAHSCF